MLSPPDLALSLFPEYRALRSRNGVQFMTLRRFAAGARINALRQFKAWKADLDAAPVDLMAAELALAWTKLMGSTPGWIVTNVTGGHSRRDDCLSHRLAVRVAERLQLAYLRCWKTRPVTGVSHPKEFRRLPPLEWVDRPLGPVLLIDDLSTSGWHVEEALTALRSAGNQASAIVWCDASTVEGLRRDWRDAPGAEWRKAQAAVEAG